VAAALISYDRQDPSFDTAVDRVAHNFLSHDGAIVADLLRQGLGLAAFVIPLVLFGWSLRLLLNRPLKGLWVKLALLPVALLLAALALSVLDQSRSSTAVDYGGAVGWGLQRAMALLDLGSLALPVSMAAAAGLGLLLLMILGLSWRDWRDLGAGAGSGAGRLAVFSGRGTVAAAGFGGRLVRRWWQARSGPADSLAAQSGPLRSVTTMPQRREPRLDRAAAPARAANGEAWNGEAPNGEAPNGERDGARLVRLVTPQARPGMPGRRGEQERQPRLDLVPDEGPVLPSLELLEKPHAAKAAVVDEDALEKNARMLETVLEDYGVRG
jgi:S-DNA-T family DNA segregation ATPase FtsK/SpoIIIE